MDSFYGGKQGISFIIKERFKTIDEMNNTFSDPNYEKVWYGEYCIIDTDNKNNPDNGKIFRRTANSAVSNKSPVYYEYIGQVVGPAGGIPKLELKTIDELKDDFSKLNLYNGGLVYYPTTTAASDSKIVYTPATNTSPNPDSLALIEDDSVVYKSGKDYYYHKDEQGTVVHATPAFKYGFYTFQGTTKDEGGNFPIATVGLGFEIPYVDFDVKVNPTPAFYNGEVSIETEKHNNFYNTYTLTIPQGAPGSFIGNIHKESTTTDSASFYKLDEDVDFINHKLMPTAEKKPSSSTSVLVGNYYYYDSKNGITTIMDKANTTSPAKFLISNNHEATVTLNSTPTSDDFGKFAVNYTDGLGSTYTYLPLLKSLETVPEYDSNGNVKKYQLKATYQGSTQGSTVTRLVGDAGPTYWGVYGHRLTKEDIDNSNGPEEGSGNLGFITDDTFVTFYYWNGSSWDALGTTSGSKITNISFVDSAGNSIFNLQDKEYPVTFKSFEEPQNGGPTFTFLERPWK